MSQTLHEADKQTEMFWRPNRTYAYLRAPTLIYHIPALPLLEKTQQKKKPPVVPTTRKYTMETQTTPASPALHPRLIQIIKLAAKRYGFRILEYATRRFWRVLRRLYARTALAHNLTDRRPPDTETEVWEITREDFERELVGHPPSSIPEKFRRR